LARQNTVKKKAFNQLINAFSKADEILVDDIEDLSTQDIRKYFLDEGILKDKTNKRQQEMMYQDVDCV
jgi:UDP-N-acetylmuramate-alanine ligase